MPATYTRVRGAGCGSGDTCEGVYVGNSRPVLAVVGTEITDPAERAQLGIGPGETAVEVSRDLLPEVK